DSIAWSFIPRGNDTHFTVVLLVRFGIFADYPIIIRQIPRYTWESRQQTQIWAETPRYTWRSPRYTWVMNSNVQETHLNHFNQDISILNSSH
ncbi:hypothetical protein PIB30_108173, partial [Stylosanthes scabra]|nr:hypothetical protein [Stylosanthes scabra]